MSGGTTTKSLNRVAPRRGKQKISPRPPFCPCYQNVLYRTDVATIFLDPDLNIRFFTPATRALFSVIPSDIGRPLADLNSFAADGNLLTDARAVLRTHAPIEREIVTQRDVWYNRRILPYRTQDNGVEGVVITFVDITERRRTADELGVARRQADLANVAKSRFLAAASHDLRQPLQTLALLQGLLSKIVEGERAQKLVARIDDTLGAIAGMLNTLLDINQIEAGTVRANRSVSRSTSCLTGCAMSSAITRRQRAFLCVWCLAAFRSRAIRGCWSR